MNKERLRETLKRDEGLNLKRHKVDEKYHIGYGFNLEIEWPQELLDYLDVEDEADIQEISQKQADYLLEWFSNQKLKRCQKLYVGVWDGLSPLRQEVLS